MLLLNCLFDVVVSYCVLLIISNEIEFFFEDVFNYFEFFLFVNFLDVFCKGFVIDLLSNVGEKEWMRMYDCLC